MVLPLIWKIHRDPYCFPDCGNAYGNAWKSFKMDVIIYTVFPWGNLCGNNRNYMYAHYKEESIYITSQTLPINGG